MATQRFAGFPEAGLRFLRALARHNDRAWFAPRKARYERELLEPMRAFVADASEALQRARIPIGGDARRSIFRLYRDVRFSSDKRPYRTHVAAYLSYDGGRDTPGGLYIHVEPGASLFAIAFYRIEPAMLQRWRVAMAQRPQRFRAVLRALAKNGDALVPPEDWEDALARMPRGFAHLADSELAPHFRLRSFCVRRRLDDRDVTSARLVQRAVAFAKSARPLLDFGWELV